MVRAIKRIGIFAGTFDPVHAGHISFALETIRKAGLDRVVFLPERRPRGKQGVEHFGHRTAMISRAIRPHEDLSLLELPDVYFDVPRTLPKLQKEFAGHKLYFLLGSDTALQLGEPSWPQDDLRIFLSSCSLIVGMRVGDDEAVLRSKISKIAHQPIDLNIITTPERHVSSSQIRKALRSNQTASGLLPSVSRYAREQWLYVSARS